MDNGFTRQEEKENQQQEHRYVGGAYYTHVWTQRERAFASASKGQLRLLFNARLVLKQHANLKVMLFQKNAFNSLQSVAQLV